MCVCVFVPRYLEMLWCVPIPERDGTLVQRLAQHPVAWLNWHAVSTLGFMMNAFESLVLPVYSV